jgi:AraC-like DNA-binding protein
MSTESGTNETRNFVGSIRQAIETLSCGEYPTIQRTAAFVGMSVRTLQRRLAHAGASHHMLVAQARFATAAAVLERTDAKILDLALDLGYSDHANFTRAFRRWTGCAPRQYRFRQVRRPRVATHLTVERQGRWAGGVRV